MNHEWNTDMYLSEMTVMGIADEVRLKCKTHNTNENEMTWNREKDKMQMTLPRFPADRLAHLLHLSMRRPTCVACLWLFMADG